MRGDHSSDSRALLTCQLQASLSILPTVMLTCKCGDARLAARPRLACAVPSKCPSCPASTATSRAAKGQCCMTTTWPSTSEAWDTVNHHRGQKHSRWLELLARVYTKARGWITVRRPGSQQGKHPAYFGSRRCGGQGTAHANKEKIAGTAGPRRSSRQQAQQS
jgi:hypothetical protein